MLSVEDRDTQTWHSPASIVAVDLTRFLSTAVLRSVRWTAHSSCNCVRCCRKPPNSSMSRITSIGQSAVGEKWRAKDWSAAKRVEAS
eukprot:10244277-Alexandrium_andersonii.AAC.2